MLELTTMGWLNNELHGYKKIDSVEYKCPDYRYLKLSICYKDGCKGSAVPFTSLFIQSQEERIFLHGSVVYLENAVKNHTDEILMISDPVDSKELCRIRKDYGLCEFKLFYYANKHHIDEILFGVRKKLLDCLIALDKEHTCGHCIISPKNKQNSLPISETDAPLRNEFAFETLESVKEYLRSKNLMHKTQNKIRKACTPEIRANFLKDILIANGRPFNNETIKLQLDGENTEFKEIEIRKLFDYENVVNIYTINIDNRKALFNEFKLNLKTQGILNSLILLFSETVSLVKSISNNKKTNQKQSSNKK